MVAGSVSKRSARLFCLRDDGRRRHTPGEQDAPGLRVPDEEEERVVGDEWHRLRRTGRVDAEW